MDIQPHHRACEMSPAKLFNILLGVFAAMTMTAVGLFIYAKYINPVEALPALIVVVPGPPGPPGPPGKAGKSIAGEKGATGATGATGAKGSGFWSGK
jgi:hypothetical protein